MAEVRFKHKFVTQYFNAHHYEKYETMSYKSDYDHSFDLIPGLSTCYIFSAIRNSVWYYPGKIVEFSNIIFISLGKHLIYYNVDFSTFTQYTQSENVATYGITTIVLN